MIKKTFQNPAVIAFMLVFIAGMTRIIPHPFNFTAMGAMALFAGANIRDRRLAYLLPLSVMLITDLVIGFHISMISVYSCFAFTVWMGTRISTNQTPIKIGSSSLLSSIIFFLITNLPFWYINLSLYPLTLQGTLQSYIMGLPFFVNQILGDLFYNFVLFGFYHLVFLKVTKARI